MAKSGPETGTGGRPRIEVPWEKINALCAMHTPAQEIIAYLAIAEEPVSRDTLDRRCKEQFGMTFAEYVTQRHLATARPKLRKLQWQSAEAGNVTMQIFLGKDVLGQTDKVVNEHTGKDGEDIKVAAQLDFTQLSTAALKELEGVLAKNDPSADNGRSAADQE